MKTDILKKLIKDAVKEVFHEEMKEILLEAVKGNKQTIVETYKPSDDRTLSFTSNNVPKTPIDAKKAYMDILNDIAVPKTGLEGEFNVSGHVDTISGALPSGQVGLDTIMNLVGKK